MKRPYTIVQRNDYKLTIYHGITPLDCDNDNVDVQVTFPGGENFSAVFFTLRNIKTLMERYKKTGECAGGLYFWASNMIIVERLNEKTLCETIDNLLAEGEFGYVFSKDGELEDIAPEDEDKLFKCFDKSLNEP